MIRSQRIFIGLSLPALAWPLHVNMCDFVYKAQIPLNAQSARSNLAVYVPHQPILVWRHTVPSISYTGLITQRDTSRPVAAIFGVVLPITLLLLDAYLWLGWRRGRLISLGPCPHCQYDLRGQRNDAKCPECGKPVTSRCVE